ncbi:MAG: cyclase family protein [Chloroflexi bacterium]|nr:cyclase family protein [Chloroflexota bacterium]
MTRAAVSRSKWLDISVPVRNDMVHWPSDPPVNISRTLDMERGDRHTLSRLSLGSHTGTHVDAPLHFIRSGIGIDRMPLEIAVGRARIIEVHDSESIKPEELARQRIRRGERLLFKTRNSSRVWQTDRFIEDFVFISAPAADFLADRKVTLVGIDYLSVGGFKAGGSDIHRILLHAGIWLIEGLDLSLASPGRYDLICLPLKIVDGDGAPARAIVRPAG